MIVPANNARLLSPDGARILALPRGRAVVVARRRYGFRGLGQSTQQLTQVGQAGAGATIGALVATGAIAGPVGALAGAAVGLVATIINTFFQPNYNKIQATTDVNSIEPYLKQNLATWLSLDSSQKFQSVQAAAIATAQGWIAKMEQLCGQVSGTAGTNCISQRAPGGCGFHVAAPYGWINGSFVPSGPNDPTGAYCWDWGYYINSISQDPNVIPDPVTGSAGTTSAQLVSGTPTAGTGPSGVVTSTSVSSGLSSVPWWAWALGGVAVIWAVAQ